MLRGSMLDVIEGRDDTDTGAGTDRRSEWRDALGGGRWGGVGGRWPAVLVLYVAIAFALAALMPLDDIDLPMHLAIGEWIVHHQAVPFIEPFAWTRAGAPYFAYSWLAQVTAYGLLAAFGPVGLHLLYGSVAAAAVVSIAMMGRAEGWRPWPTLLLAVLQFTVLTRVTPSLRPQLFLYALVPIAWAAAAHLRRNGGGSGRKLWPFAALFVAGAIAANTHILFALTGAPVFVLAVDPGARKRSVLLAALAVVAGWLCSPYALAWPQVFRLNFAPNLLFRHPSPISEYQPGFNVSPVIGSVLALAPWFGIRAPVRDMDGRAVWRSGGGGARRDLAMAALWLIGLIAFSKVEKGITIWWLVSLPLLGVALSRIPDPRSAARARMRVGVLAAIGLLLCAEHALLGRAPRSREGTVVTRTFPGSWSTAAEPLAAWLQRNARPTARARLFTTFNYGSYLTWRLPAYSASIDSRTIFPDSVAAPEAVMSRTSAAWQGGSGLGPWRSADLAIVPVRYPVASVLDTAAGWLRLAEPEQGEAGESSLGLWARRAWWDSVSVSGQ